MSTHDELRTLIEDMQAGSKDWERESAARLEALNRQCDKLLAVIDAAQAGVEALNSADDGWIPWDGLRDSTPLYSTSIVEVRFRDGQTDRARAGSFHWRHDGAPWDIVAYKVEG